MLMGLIGTWVRGFRRLYDGEFRDWTGDFECCAFAFWHRVELAHSTYLHIANDTPKRPLHGSNISPSQRPPLRPNLNLLRIPLRQHFLQQPRHRPLLLAAGDFGGRLGFAFVGFGHLELVFHFRVVGLFVAAYG